MFLSISKAAIRCCGVADAAKRLEMLCFYGISVAKTYNLCYFRGIFGAAIRYCGEQFRLETVRNLVFSTKLRFVLRNSILCNEK